MRPLPLGMTETDRERFRNRDFIERLASAVGEMAVQSIRDGLPRRPSPTDTFSAADIYSTPVKYYGPLRVNGQVRTLGPLTYMYGSKLVEESTTGPTLEYVALDEVDQVLFTVSTRRRGRTTLLGELVVSRHVDVRVLAYRLKKADMIPSGYLPELKRRLRIV